MPKYAVIAVDYKNNHIDKLLVMKDLGDRLDGPRTLLTRAEVIAMLERGDEFTTFTNNAAGKWVRGASVRPFPVTTQYLKTAKDTTDKDNLENLPSIPK
ncbi:MAG: hypothetical protein RL095_245 [Verrucomicrobiota bacterium]|jgi:hypothetical protein